MVETNALLHGRGAGTTPGRSTPSPTPAYFHHLSSVRKSSDDTKRRLHYLVAQSQGPTTAEAAQIILDVHGATMLQSGSDWLNALRELFLDIISLSERSGLRRATAD